MSSKTGSTTMDEAPSPAATLQDFGLIGRRWSVVFEGWYSKKYQKTASGQVRLMVYPSGRNMSSEGLTTFPSLTSGKMPTLQVMPQVMYAIRLGSKLAKYAGSSSNF